MVSADGNDLLYSILGNMNDESSSDADDSSTGDIDISDFTQAEIEKMFIAIDKAVEMRTGGIKKLVEKAYSNQDTAMATFGDNLTRINQAILKSDILNGTITASTMDSLRKGYGGMAILYSQQKEEFNNGRQKTLMKKLDSMNAEEFAKAIDALCNSDTVLKEEAKLRQNPRDIYLGFADPASFSARLYKEDDIQAILQTIKETPTQKELASSTKASVPAPKATAQKANVRTATPSLNTDKLEISYAKELLRLMEEMKAIPSSEEDVASWSSLNRALERTQKMYQHSSAGEINIEDLSQDLDDLVHSYGKYQQELSNTASLSPMQIQRCTIGNEIARLYRNLEKQVYGPATNYVDLLAAKIVQAKSVVAWMENKEEPAAKEILLNTALFMEKVDALRENAAYLRYITSDEVRNTCQDQGLAKFVASDYDVLFEEMSEIIANIE